jgi:hypothetical protein
MSNALIPCQSCARHVRATESACAFCAAALPVSARAVKRAVPKARLGRAATFAFGAAALAVSAAACGDDDGDDTTPPVDLGTDGGMVVQDLGRDSATPDEDLGTADLGAGDLGTEQDLGGVGPLYGGPPVDAGQPDLGGVAPAYGIPPTP